MIPLHAVPMIRYKELIETLQLEAEAQACYEALHSHYDEQISIMTLAGFVSNLRYFLAVPDTKDNSTYTAILEVIEPLFKQMPDAVILFTGYTRID